MPSALRRWPWKRCTPWAIAERAVADWNAVFAPLPQVTHDKKNRKKRGHVSAGHGRVGELAHAVLLWAWPIALRVGSWATRMADDSDGCGREAAAVARMDEGDGVWIHVAHSVVFGLTAGGRSVPTAVDSEAGRIVVCS